MSELTYIYTIQVNNYATIDDLKVDVFGMGTIAFYLLTGVPNFTIF